MRGSIRRSGGSNSDTHHSKTTEKSKCHRANKTITIILVEKRNLDPRIVFISLNCCKACVLLPPSK